MLKKRTTAGNINKNKKIVRREYYGPAHSEAELHLHRRRLGSLAKRLKPSHVRALVAAFIHVESKSGAARIFSKIAKRYGVSSGDLEQALAIKLGPRVWGVVKDLQQRK